MGGISTGGASGDWLVSFLLLSIREGDLSEADLRGRVGVLGVEGPDLKAVSWTLRRLREEKLILAGPETGGPSGEPGYELSDLGEAYLESWAGSMEEPFKPEYPEKPEETDGRRPESAAPGFVDAPVVEPYHGGSRESRSTEVPDQALFWESVEPAPGVVFVQTGKGLRQTSRALDAGAEAFLGYRPEELAHRDAFELVHHHEASTLRAATDDIGGRPGASSSVRLRFKDASGSWRLVEAVVQNVAPTETLAPGGPEAGLVVVNLSDLSKVREREERLAYQALHDPLTGLPNRNLFVDRLEHAVARRERHSGELAVIFIDLDDFKSINDSWGHEAGDRLLKEVAEVIGSCLRPEDTAARIGGDEFTVLLETSASGGEAVRGAVGISGRILGGLAEAFARDGREPLISPSLGIALTGDGIQTPEDLLHAADLAMYRAKAAGKGRYEIYEKSMSEKVLERLELEKDLRRAAADPGAEFQLRYQPKISLSTGRIAGVEALLRWDHPVRGLVSPAEFVPLAEDIGLMVFLGRWVLQEACRRGKKLLSLYRGEEPWSVSVNLSAGHLLSPGVERDVAAALSESGLRASNLSVELAERALVEEAAGAADVADVAGALDSLKSLGVRVEIDDFGTGYSSLASLTRFPVDALKIDNYLTDPPKRGDRAAAAATAVASAVVSLAHELRLEVVGEGVETPDQLAQLRSLGCDYGQGYHFSRPLEDRRMEALLREDPRW